MQKSRRIYLMGNSPLEIIEIRLEEWNRLVQLELLQLQGFQIMDLSLEQVMEKNKITRMITRLILVSMLREVEGNERRKWKKPQIGKATRKWVLCREGKHLNTVKKMKTLLSQLVALCLLVKQLKKAKRHVRPKYKKSPFTQSLSIFR